ncbi:hypothetical protein LEMLEM_LOCUS20471 [Lemmus lemmus]
MQDRTVEVVLVPHPPPELQGPSFPSMALIGSVRFIVTRGGGWGLGVPKCVLMSQHPQWSLTVTSQQWSQSGQAERRLGIAVGLYGRVAGARGLWGRERWARGAAREARDRAAPSRLRLRSWRLTPYPAGPSSRVAGSA